jgi:hypothetical protein
MKKSIFLVLIYNLDNEYKFILRYLGKNNDDEIPSTQIGFNMKNFFFFEN